MNDCSQLFLEVDNCMIQILCSTISDAGVNVAATLDTITLVEAFSTNRKSPGSELILESLVYVSVAGVEVAPMGIF